MEKVTQDLPVRRYEQDSLVSELEAICDGHVHDELPTVTLARATALSALLMHSRAMESKVGTGDKNVRLRAAFVEVAQNYPGATMSVADVRAEISRLLGEPLGSVNFNDRLAAFLPDAVLSGSSYKDMKVQLPEA